MRNEACHGHWWRRVRRARDVAHPGAWLGQLQRRTCTGSRACRWMRPPRAAWPRASWRSPTGQREGLTRLMRRLTSPTAHGRLPDVSTVPIERYVNSFEIAQEKVGPNRYLGMINVSYMAAEVQSLLDSAGIPYVHAPLRPDPGRADRADATARPAAWDESSPWRAAWYRGDRAGDGRWSWRCRWAISATSRPRPRRAASAGRSRGARRAGQPLRHDDGDRGHRPGRRSIPERPGGDRAAAGRRLDGAHLSDVRSSRNLARIRRLRLIVR